MDNICIKMPNTLYEFLTAMAVAQDYMLQLSVGWQQGKRDTFQVTFRMDDKFKYFEPCLRVIKENIPVFDYSGWDEDLRFEFDNFVRFDENFFQRAKKISDSVGSPITTSLSFLIGSGAGRFPFLRALNLKQDEQLMTDVLILNWEANETSIFYEYLTSNYPNLSIIVDPRDLSVFEPKEITEYLSHFDCVIGMHGVATYLAGALKKVVVDMFTDYNESVYYAAAHSSEYIPILGQRMTAQHIWNIWEKYVWVGLRERLSRMNSHEGLVLTGSQVSTVDNVGEKSGDRLTLKSEQ